MPISPIENYFTSDAAFQQLYPYAIQTIALRHWTPLRIAELAIGFLADKPGSKILDIGSGIGKFCLTGAYYKPDVHFYGVEQRAYFINHAVRAQKELGLSNVSFIQGNFTQLDLREFDHFYFFNSFYENLDNIDRIDEKIDYSEAIYEYYVYHLKAALKEMPKGTKIVTYHSLLSEIPPGYELLDKQEKGDLNFWIRR